MSGSTGTKITQLPAASALVAADLFPVTQGGVGGVTRAATLAQIRTGVFDNNSQPTIGVNNASTDPGVTAGFTLDIGGARRATITGSRNGATLEGRLAFSVANLVGTLEQVVSLQIGGVVLSKPIFLSADPTTSIAGVIPGRASDSVSKLTFTNNSQSTTFATITVGTGSFALGVGAGTHGFSATEHTVPADPTSALGVATKQMVDLKAALLSPVFTGNPSAVTQAQDMNNTRLATTAFVVGQVATVAPLMNGTAAVGTSLRYARQDHVHASDTTRAPLASPTFTGTPVLPNVNGGPLAGFRNLIINGNPMINQRGYVSATATGAANQYTLDRWRVVTSGQSLSWTDALGVRTVTFPAGGGEQVIEAASNLGGLHRLSWTGTATATINGTAVVNGASVTLTANTNTTLKMSSGTASLIQLEAGTAVTPFERRPRGMELNLCQRYYCTLNLSVQAGATGLVIVPFFFSVAMRAAPAVTNLAAGTLVTATHSATSVADVQSGSWQVNVTTGGGSITGRIDAFSAEF